LESETGILTLPLALATQAGHEAGHAQVAATAPLHASVAVAEITTGGEPQVAEALEMEAVTTGAVVSTMVTELVQVAVSPDAAVAV
jgi:hypothetical protein